MDAPRDWLGDSFASCKARVQWGPRVAATYRLEDLCRVEHGGVDAGQLLGEHQYDAQTGGPAQQPAGERVAQAHGRRFGGAPRLLLHDAQFGVYVVKAAQALQCAPCPRVVLAAPQQELGRLGAEGQRGQLPHAGHHRERQQQRPVARRACAVQVLHKTPRPPQRAASPSTHSSPSMLAIRLADVPTTPAVVATAPRNAMGATSIRYIGARPLFRPQLIPIKNRPTSSTCAIVEASRRRAVTRRSLTSWRST